MWCTKAEGHASRWASSREGSGSKQLSLVAIHNMTDEVHEEQKDLKTVRGIHEELHLHNDLYAINIYLRSNIKPRGWDKREWFKVCW